MSFGAVGILGDFGGRERLDVVILVFGPVAAVGESVQGVVQYAVGVFTLALSTSYD